MADPVVWRKSVFSGANSCVEMAFVKDHVWLRDSKNKRGPILRFTVSEWQAFLRGVQGHEFDLPAD
jgi:hypothetical protein